MGCKKKMNNSNGYLNELGIPLEEQGGYYLNLEKDALLKMREAEIEYVKAQLNYANHRERVLNKKLSEMTTLAEKAKKVKGDKKR